MTRQRSMIVFACLAAMLILIGCCAAPEPTPAPKPTGPIGKITFAGSTSLQPLVAELGKAYRADNPGVLLEIAAGGSGVGIQAIHDGTVDIGMASRVLKAEEAKGIERHQVAVDVIATVVHKDNPVDNLTLYQLRDIYLGEITNWNEVGGPDLTIAAVSREQSSGTRGAFDKLVLDGGEPNAPHRFVMMTAGDVAAKVSSNYGAIGYVGFGNLDEGIKILAINGKQPGEDTVRAGTYPLVRPLLLLTGPLTQPLAHEFIAYSQSATGQGIVSDAGWIAIQRSDAD